MEGWNFTSIVIVVASIAIVFPIKRFFILKLVSFETWVFFLNLCSFIANIQWEKQTLNFLSSVEQ
jgi:hypothetical protein